MSSWRSSSSRPHWINISPRRQTCHRSANKGCTRRHRRPNTHPFLPAFSSRLWDFCGRLSILPCWQGCNHSSPSVASMPSGPTSAPRARKRPADCESASSIQHVPKCDRTRCRRAITNGSFACGKARLISSISDWVIGAEPDTHFRRGRVGSRQRGMFSHARASWSGRLSEVTLNLDAST